MRPTRVGRASGFRHEALIYEHDDELLVGTRGFLRAGLEAGETMLVAMPERTLALVRGEMEGSRERIQFVDMAQLGRNPGRIISAWKDFLASGVVDDRAARGIGEPVWPARSSAELEECSRHEALLNLAFAGAPAWSLLCPYDARRLDPGTIHDVEQNHPYLHDASSVRISAEYRDPCLEGNPFDGELPQPTDVQVEEAFTSPSDLARMRGTVAEQARAVGLAVESGEGLVMVVNEVATNSLLHGGGGGQLCLWREDGQLCCDIRDGGRLRDPLAGRIRPGTERRGGHGLWLANQLCDLVQVRSNAARTIVRLRMAT